MNRQYFYIILTIFLFTSCRKDTGSSNPVLEQMCQRLFSQHADSFEFELLNDSNQMDRFILESAHKKIRIKGNNNNSLAVGLNHYLKYYCHTNVSWYASDSIDMPEELPVIPQPISIRSKCDNRFFLNYCTFGYQCLIGNGLIGKG